MVHTFKSNLKTEPLRITLTLIIIVIIIITTIMITIVIRGTL